MKQTAVYLLLFATFYNLAIADKITIEISNLEEKTMMVTYTRTAKKAGLNEYVYPTKGYPFTDELEVINVFENNTQQDLDYEIIQVRNSSARQTLKMLFSSPIPDGGSYEITTTVEGTSDNIVKELDGSYTFHYTTVHTAYFILPEGYAITYANYPILTYEKDGRTVVEVKDDE